MKNQEAHSKCQQETMVFVIEIQIKHWYKSNTAMLWNQQNPYEEPIV